MNKKIKDISSYFYRNFFQSFVYTVMFVIGVRYLVSTQLMPHHLRVLGMTWTELTPPTRTLMLTLMKGTGLVGICTAVSLAVLLAVPFRRHEVWSHWAILLVGVTALVPMLIGAVRVHSETGVAVPWWPPSGSHSGSRGTSSVSAGEGASETRRSPGSRTRATRVPEARPERRWRHALSWHPWARETGRRASTGLT